MHRFAFLLLAVSSCVAAAPAKTEETWMSVLIDGRKIGHMLDTRQVKADRVITLQRMEISLERAGIKVGLTSEETSEETPAGKPLAFESRSRISGAETVVRGTLRDDGQVDVTTIIGGNKQQRTMPWPAGAALAEGLRLSGLRNGLKPGTEFEDIAFQSSGLEALHVRSKVIGAEWLDLPEGRRELIRVQQDIDLPGASTRTFAFVDKEQKVHKLIMPIMGFELTMLACTKACAQAENQSTDLLQHAVLQAPRALAADELAHGLKLTVRASDGGEAPNIAQTDEQSVHVIGNGSLELRIAPLTADSSVARAKPLPADFLATDWLQSNNKEIVDMAKQAAVDGKTPIERMQLLESFVRGYIRQKNLSVGYASALEVVHTREGDCTEHAVLLAALGRALGIATRVVDGLAYTDHFAGAEHVFVPHAWAQAWVGDHWQSFDAALNGFDAGHIALSVGDGDPWRFYSGLNTLGRLRLQELAPLAAPAATH